MQQCRTEIIQKLEQLPEDLKEAMLTNFAVNGAVPLTRDDVNGMMQQLRVSIVEAMSRDRTSTGTADSGSGDAVVPTVSYAAYFWGGKRHTTSAGELEHKHVFDQSITAIYDRMLSRWWV